MTLVEVISKHVIEDGECWNWVGAMQSCGTTPTMRWQGSTGAVRRFILLERGDQIQRARKQLATYTCGNPKCVNPAHTGWATRKTVQLRTFADGSHPNSLVRSKRISDMKRQHSKLTFDQALQIREADGPQKAIAARFNVSQATISAIKRGKTWLSYSGNPFAGLGARA